MNSQEVSSVLEFSNTLDLASPSSLDVSGMTTENSNLAPSDLSAIQSHPQSDFSFASMVGLKGDFPEEIKTLNQVFPRKKELEADKVEEKELKLAEKYRNGEIKLEDLVYEDWTYFHAAASVYKNKAAYCELEKHDEFVRKASILYQAIFDIYNYNNNPVLIDKKERKIKRCLDSLGEIHYYLGNYEKAQKYFNEALKQGDHYHYWSCYHLFLVLYKRKQFGMASNALDQAIKSEKNFVRRNSSDPNKKENVENAKKFIEYMEKVKSRVDREIKEQNRPRFFRNTTKSVNK